ncbi:MAG: MBL fold metallo-hydrolase [Spirochaetaceae bacterium]
MPYLHLLGTGAAMSDPHRTVTMLAVEDENDLYLIDCGGDAVQRLLLLGAPLEKLRGVIVTHEHPDHVAGFPLLMEKLWLAGRTAPVDVYGIESALRTAERLLDTFDTSGWEGMPEIRRHEVAYEPGAPVLSEGPWSVTASPGVHSVPVVGLRVAHQAEEGKTPTVIAYSCDTEYSEDIVELASDADVLIHEATGSMGNHSSVHDAARVAARAACGRVLLVHLPPAASLTDDMIAEARRTFANLDRGREGGTYRW